MPTTERLPHFLRRLDVPRIVAIGLVATGHVVLLLLLQNLMHTAALVAEPGEVPDVALSLVLVPVETSVLPALPLPVSSPAPPTPRAPIGTQPPTERERSDSSTSAVFEEDETDSSERKIPLNTSVDVFVDAPDAAEPRATVGFQEAPYLKARLPTHQIRLPDRPSLFKAYWAVPEGENLQGRAARKYPLLGLLLRATGAIGSPVCPPESEHPECLQRLLDDLPP